MVEACDYQSENNAEGKTRVVKRLAVDVCVIGAGPTGLSCAYHILKRRQLRLYVVEKEGVVGGLASTHCLTHPTGNFYHDLGPHRLASQLKHNYGYLLKLQKLLKLRKTVAVYYKGELFRGILGITHLLGPAILQDSPRLLRSLLGVSYEFDNFESAAREIYGEALYTKVVKPIAEKTWGLSPNKLVASLLVERIRGGLFSLLTERTFLYPKHGIGSLWEAVCTEIKKLGGKILLQEPVVELVVSENLVRKVVTKNFEVNAKKFVVTIPLDKALEMVGYPTKSLPWRSQIQVKAIFEEENLTDYKWAYVLEKNVEIVRLHEPKVWSKDLAPKGKTMIIFEYFVDEDTINENKLTYYEELTRKYIENYFGWDNLREVAASFVKRSHPLPSKTSEKLRSELLELASKLGNCVFVGRNGRFRYDNQDHAIESGVRAARWCFGEDVSFDDIPTAFTI